MRTVLAILVPCLVLGCHSGTPHPMAKHAHDPIRAHKPAPQVQAPREIRVRAPQQQVIVQTPTPAPAQAPVAMVPQAGMPGQAMVPVAGPQPAVGYPAAVPQQAMPAHGGLVANPAPVVATTTQTVKQSRARWAFGLDWVKVKLPIPKVFAIPGPQSVTTETEYAPVRQAPPAYSAQTMRSVQVHLPPQQPVAYPVQQPQYYPVPAPQAPVYQPVAAPQPVQPTVMVPQQPVVAVPQPSIQITGIGAAPCQSGCRQPNSAGATPKQKAAMQDLQKRLEKVQQMYIQAEKKLGEKK